ncbi:MAG: hypothetical protein ACFWT4_05855 [Citrobacter braakii]|jgi:DeoR/GlpR family transcriptional regulator of sugar metabolism
MIPEQRRDFIYRYVHEKNAASFNELADLMSVSHMTVRRDIQLLEEEGKVIAINGGVKLNNLLKSELPWREKAELNHDVKRKMGQLAAMLIEPDKRCIWMPVRRCLKWRKRSPPATVSI